VPAAVSRRTALTFTAFTVCGEAPVGRVVVHNPCVRHGAREGALGAPSRIAQRQWTTMLPPLSGEAPLVVNTVTLLGLLIRIEIVSPFLPLVPLSTTETVNE
jgi:hypothetical protein